MAKTLPQHFPIPSENVIASYDYVDISEGVGFVHYKGARVCVDNNVNNDVYILTTQPIISNFAFSTSTTGSMDIDFDVTFNLPKVLVGTMYIIMPVGISVSDTINPSITVRKWDGSTETQIVAATAGTPIVGVGSTTYKDVILKITIPKTKFKRNETLRVTFTSTTDGTSEFYYDPTGTQTTNFPYSGGVFSVLAPFRLDL